MPVRVRCSRNQHLQRNPDNVDEQANMLQRRSLIEGKPWSVDAVEGCRDLFEIMCIDASRFTKDGNMWPASRQPLCKSSLHVLRAF